MDTLFRYSLPQLQRFLVLAEELHFSKAANRLNVSQPLLSEQIRALETSIGAPLFARSSRKVELTPAGRYFSERVRLLLNALGSAATGARELSKGGQEPLRIGYTDEFSRMLLPGLIRHLKDREPSAEIHLNLGNVPELLRRLAEGLIDLAFVCPLPEEELPPPWRMSIVEPARLVVGLSADHPLASREGLTLEEVADEPFVGSASLDAGSELMAERLFAQRGLRRDVVQRVLDPYLLNSLVGAGVGALIATADDFALQSRVVAVPLTPFVEVGRAAIWNANSLNDLLLEALAFIKAEKCSLRVV